MKNLRKRLLRLLTAICQRFGTRLHDPRGKYLGRAIVIPWGGKIHLIGPPNHIHLRPVPMPQPTLRYWCQTMAWEEATFPDYPRLAGAAAAAALKVCHVVICHLPPAETRAVYDRWRAADPQAGVLIAYGGKEEVFQQLPPEIPAVFVADPTLRTVDHIRERQQYTGVFRAATEWIAGNLPETTHVHVVEFDVVPVVDGIGARLVSAMDAEGADLSGFGMADFTGTVHPHNCYELARPDFFDYLRGMSRREVRDRFLVMLGCSSIWRRDTFDQVAALDAPREYLEMAMPTLAHHLGFRVRPLPADQERFMSYQGDRTDLIPEYAEQGAWLVHPCKKIWSAAT